jgi:hypothetical protein
MRVTIHSSGFYDWEPVPADVEVKPADVKAKRVKPTANGGWLMRVERTGDTHTDVALPENQLIAQIVQEMVRDHQPRTRRDAVNLLLSRHVMPHHAHKSWMRKVECHDDGPDEKMFADMVDVQVKAGNISPHDLEEMTKLYCAEDHAPEERHAVSARSIAAHFGVSR